MEWHRSGSRRQSAPSMGFVARPTEGLATLESAFALIQVLAGSGPGGASVSRLCAEVGMPRRTVYRYLNTLVNLGMVEVTGEQSYAYRLGPAVDELAMHSSRQREFLRRSAAHVDTLARSTGQLVHCTVFDQGSVVTVAVASGAPREENEPALAVVGSRRPAHATASGKVFLSYQPRAVDAYVTRELTARTPFTITDPARLREECKRTAANGFAVDNHEFSVGVCCLAVPVWGERQHVVGALSVSWRTPDEIRIPKDFLVAMKAAAHDFSQSIGGEPN
jgi:DNA-binding IclR family transcriptional regulator